MARAREFEEAEVVERAADAFTTHGYGGTSLSTLMEATGLGKQSLYNTFGDKSSLYCRAVDVAVARFAEDLGPLERAPTGRAAVARFFDVVVELCTSDDPARRACIVSAGLLEGVDPPAAAAKLKAKHAATHELLRAQVERGQRDGSIASTAPSATLADVLIALMGGLRVAARAEHPPARLRAVADAGLALLDHR